jgi:hypothetical protein
MVVRNNWGRRKSSRPSLPADLDAQLKKVRSTAPPPPPPDDLLYKYLTRVYRLERQIASSSDWQLAIRKYHAAHAPRTLKNYAGIIINLTADHVTSKTKHKYVTALEYASADDVQPENLQTFIQQQGGLNKCVELWNQKYCSPRKTPRKKAP